jgi:hypothetical protein
MIKIILSIFFIGLSSLASYSSPFLHDHSYLYGINHGMSFEELKEYIDHDVNYWHDFDSGFIEVGGVKYRYARIEFKQSKYNGQTDVVTVHPYFFLFVDDTLTLGGYIYQFRRHDDPHHRKIGDELYEINKEYDD